VVLDAVDDASHVARDAPLVPPNWQAEAGDEVSELVPEDTVAPLSTECSRVHTIDHFGRVLVLR
jgi:hypothetical protein